MLALDEDEVDLGGHLRLGFGLALGVGPALTLLGGEVLDDTVGRLIDPSFPEGREIGGISGTRTYFFAVSGVLDVGGGPRGRVGAGPSAGWTGPPSADPRSL